MEKQVSSHKDRKRGLRIFNWVIVAFIALGILWVIMQFTSVIDSSYTDNAQVKRHIVPVNSRVRGYIKEIRFSEYQHVNKGDTLIIIDDSEYLLQLAQTEANYINALAGKDAMETMISTTSNDVSVSDAGIEEVRVRLENAKTNLKRYENLLEQEAVTQDMYDNVKTDYDAISAKYDMLTRKKRSTILNVEEQTKRLPQSDANIKQAKATLDMAALNLTYTVIVAPCSGIVGKKDLQVGQLIQPGQSVVTIVDETTVWIIANYKERQTRSIDLGDDVEITVDAVEGIVFKGKVAAVSNATGSASSLIPTDNATGNFVKIEQRIPIRIEFTDVNDKTDLDRLKAGMSAEAYIKK